MAQGQRPKAGKWLEGGSVVVVNERNPPWPKMGQEDDKKKGGGGQEKRSHPLNTERIELRNARQLSSVCKTSREEKRERERERERERDA